jgi:ArsR family metal-binding transcriptional regulator
MNYLESISLTKILPCLSEPDKVIVIGQPSRQLNEVIPYLATLPGIIVYNPETFILSFRRQPGFMTIYPDKVYITQAKNSEEGIELLKALTDAINETREHRTELIPVKTIRHAPRPLDIWSLLPQTNCRQCGEATCMAFAVKLWQQDLELNECAPLKNDLAFSDRQSALEAML